MPDNYYNIFILVDEKYVSQSIWVAEFLINSNGVPTDNNKWGFLSPRLYVVSVKINDTYFYETGKKKIVKILINDKLFLAGLGLNHWSMPQFDDIFLSKRCKYKF